MKTPEEVLTFFPITYEKIEPLHFGHIHKTWRIEGEKGHILQWVNPIFGEAVMEDIDAVTKHLRGKGITTFEVIHTHAGALLVSDDTGFWRLFSLIPGEVYLIVTSPQIAFESGRILGEFHQALSDFSYTFKYERPLNRDTATLFSLYKESLARNTEQFDSELTDAVTCIEDLPSLYLPTTLRKHVTQCDPKISNILFSPLSHKAVAIVDLDDCNARYNVLVDIGDALRSWCQGKEDDTETGLSIELFRAGVEGYLKGAGDLLTDEERSLIPQAVKLLTLELACRFARDIVDDNYFGFDAERFSSRKAHNRARVLAQVSFYRELVANEEALRSDL